MFECSNWLFVGVTIECFLFYSFVTICVFVCSASANIVRQMNYLPKIFKSLSLFQFFLPIAIPFGIKIICGYVAITLTSMVDFCKKSDCVFVCEPITSNKKYLCFVPDRKTRHVLRTFVSSVCYYTEMFAQPCAIAENIDAVFR